MSVKTIVVVLLAVVCGLSAAWGVNQFSRSADATVLPKTAPIVVAKTEIPRGRMLVAEDVEIRQWPGSAIVRGSLSKMEDVVDRAALTPLVVGEPVLEGKLAAKNSGRGLAALVPNGMRAYTIQASRVASNVAGFILPGNRVDVLLTLRGRHGDDTGGGSTTTLLQAVEILAVDQQLDAPADNKSDPEGLRSVTLLVTPEQASLLDLGQNMGQLTLSLRNPEDCQEAHTRPATLDAIRYRQERPMDTSNVDSPPEQLVGMAEVSGSTQAHLQTMQIMTLRGLQHGYIQVGSK